MADAGGQDGGTAAAPREGPGAQNGQSAPDAPPLLEVQDITRRFGDILANDSVSLTLRRGEIHALLGENGAGKSTLVKIIYGVLRPDSGRILIEGRPVRIASPAEARALGIGMVFQHFSLFEPLSVAENIALALPQGTADAALKARIATISETYGLPLDPDAIIADLSVGERQRVEIVRALLSDPRILILDEPTSVLTPQEARQLFATLKTLAAEGRGILYISHRLEEVREICDAATVLRHGRVVAEVADPRRETAASLARLMVGEDIHAVKAAPPPEEPGPPLLHVRDLTLPADGPFGVALYGVSLDVRAGEVVAIAGVAGNGQRELFRALSGERLAQGHGVIHIEGRDVSLCGINARRRAGAAFVPEERLGHACVPEMSLTDNVVLTRHAASEKTQERLVRHGLINMDAARRICARIIGEHDVRGAAPEKPARALSGGNLQKFIMGRELDRQPRVFVVNQPTWGVDAGAAAIIRQRLVDLARAGAAVLVISQDLDEIFEIADRIAVISRGELSPARPAAELDREAIGLLMAGAHEKRHGRADNGSLAAEARP